MHTAICTHTNYFVQPKAALLLGAMNKTETLVLLQGAPGVGIGNTAAIPRLGVPSFRLEDGPSGVVRNTRMVNSGY